MINVTGVVPNSVHTVYSSFGPVNDLLIERALAMLMQTNADLFSLTNVAVRTSVAFTVPKIFESHNLAMSSYELNMMSDCA